MRIETILALVLLMCAFQQPPDEQKQIDQQISTLRSQIAYLQSLKEAMRAQPLWRDSDRAKEIERMRKRLQPKKNVPVLDNSGRGKVT